MTDHTEDYERFQYWLVDMDDALHRFFIGLDPALAEKLDYSPESLKLLEAWLLSRYKTVDEVKPMSQAKTIDGAARYAGETFRKNLGGKWHIDYEDPKNAYYGKPQLMDMKGQRTQT